MRRVGKSSPLRPVVHPIVVRPQQPHTTPPSSPSRRPPSSQALLSSRRRSSSFGLLLLSVTTIGALVTLQQRTHSVRELDVLVPPVRTQSTSHNNNNKGRLRPPLLPAFFLPPPIQQPPSHPDFGGLDYQSLLPRNQFQRKIRRFDNDVAQDYRWHVLERWDGAKEEFMNHVDELEYHTMDCVPPQWSFKVSQNCNTVHELSYDRPISRHYPYNYTFLAHGHYRETFLFESNNHQFVVKNFRNDRSLTLREVFKINTEALLLEELTSSPQSSNIYGHCGSTVLVERAFELTYQILPRLSEEYERGRLSAQEAQAYYEQRGGVVEGRNNLTAVEKLDMAIAMVESIASLHGFSKGVIAHDDISVDQWMLSEDGRIILNDFNQAFILEYNAEEEAYCRYRSRAGQFKSPEYDSFSVRESADMWALGSMMYSILVGLRPYYYERHGGIEKQQVLAGVPPFFDPRFAELGDIEHTLYHVIQDCHNFDPEERPTVFDVLRRLRDAKQRQERKKRYAVYKR